MKKLILASLILGTTALALFTGCKKDDDNNSNPDPNSKPNKSVIDLLTGGTSRTWKPITEIVNGIPGSQDSCNQDDRITLIKPGNAVTLDFGKDHCNSYEPDSLNGTWVLSNDDKTITLKMTYMGVPVTQSFDLVNLTDEQMVAKTISQGDTTITTYNVAN